MRNILFAIVLLALVASWTAERVVPMCVREYVNDVSSMGLNDSYLRAILDRVENDLTFVPPAYNGPQTILDIGPGAVRYSPVFRHLTQLNIPGIDRRGKSSFDCQYENKPTIRKEQLYSLNSTFIQVNGRALHLPIITNWLGLVNKQRNTLLILNDITDEEYYSYINKSDCRSSGREHTLFDYCCVPMLPVGPPFSAHNLVLGTSPYWLKSFSFESVKMMLAAYRKLLKCVVPPEQLLIVNIDQTPPVEYWTKLTSFLNISVTSAQLKYLSRGGSICDNSAEYPSEARIKALEKCAGQYADSMSSMFGLQFRSLLFNRLMEPPLFRREAPSTTRRLILNAGPGTTATRSLHLAMSLLNVTGRHFLAFNNTLGPQSLTVWDIDSDMKVFKIDTSNRPIYWSDTPVAERWWHLMMYYPRTRVLVTDVKNDTQWFDKRIKDHCLHGDAWGVWSWCTIPIPVDFFLYSTLSQEFFYSVHLLRTNATMNHYAFDAYRELVRCAVPPEQLKWIFITDYTPTSFWKELVSFVEVNISTEAMTDLIAGGVPRCGATGCMFGGKKVYSVTVYSETFKPRIGLIKGCSQAVQFHLSFHWTVSGGNSVKVLLPSETCS